MTVRTDAGPARQAGGGPAEADAIQVRLDDLLAERGITLTELADRVGITIVNLSILKNGRARAIRFSPCPALRGTALPARDLLTYRKPPRDV